MRARVCVSERASRSLAYLGPGKGSLEGRGGRSRAVEVHVEPLGVAAVPHARLLRLAGARAALAVHVLRQADVGDAGGILADQVHVRVEDGGVHRLTVLTQHWGGRTRETRFIDKR